MPRKNTEFLEWILHFSPWKIILKTEKGDFFVRPKFCKNFFVNQDKILAKVVKKSEWNRLAEVIVIKLLERSNKIFIWKKIWKKIFFSPNIASIDHIIADNFADFPDTTVKFQISDNKAKILEIFEFENDEEIETILFLNNISTSWSSEIQKQEKFLVNQKIFFSESSEKIPVNNLLANLENLENFSKNNSNLPLAKIVENNFGEKRISLESWFTMTIDGSDAKDLDDAISIAKYKNGDYLLAVSIADVSYFVTEKSPLDNEAYRRGTSIYMGDRVIPMLVEGLSNNLCSLNPDNPKLSLTCLMKLDHKTGKVLHTDIFESVIHSNLRGEYNTIYNNFLQKNYENNIQKYSIETCFELFEILKNRRKKEWKISFETTELYFDFDKNQKIQNIRKRERNDAHKMIEEFMVLANEEVAKWCTKRKIPFLSRYHSEPSDDSTKIIHKILGHNREKSKTAIKPSDIENFLSKLNVDEQFFASRLILPKMSKAEYSYGKNGHFGLALENYSHFTSPIRRYPDLITHRLIHLYLSRKLDEKTRQNYDKKLQKIAEICSQNEKIAENIERTTDKIFVQRYMQNHIGEIMNGKISSLTNWAIFVELDIGVEVMILLPRFHNLQLDENIWALIDKNQKIIYQIGQKSIVKIEKIDKLENKIIAKLEKIL